MLRMRRVVRHNDRGLFALGAWVTHEGQRYVLNQAAIDSLYSRVWIQPAPHIGSSLPNRLLLYREQNATSETFIGHADLVRA